MTRMDAQLAPRYLCNQHLLGNHNEAHQLAGYLKNAHPGDGGHLQKLVTHAAYGHIDLTKLQNWHDRLARELLDRGYAHNSPLKVTVTVPIGAGMISRTSAGNIMQRCDECRNNKIGETA